MIPQPTARQLKRGTVVDGQRRCTICDTWKPIGDFIRTAAGSPAGWCKPCKAKQEREKRAEKKGTYTEADVARFWSRVDKNGPVFKDLGPCWVWQGASRNHEGYGQFHFMGRVLSPHTIALILTKGIHGSRELFADHMCQNRRCCNPDHLRLVTPRQNAVENNSSFFAQNAAKTHCKNGHPFDGPGSDVARVRVKVKKPKRDTTCTARICLHCFPSYRNNPNRIDQ